MGYTHPTPSLEGPAPKEWMAMQSRGATSPLFLPHPGRVP